MKKLADTKIDFNLSYNLLPLPKSKKDSLFKVTEEGQLEFVLNNLKKSGQKP